MGGSKLSCKTETDRALAPQKSRGEAGAMMLRTWCGSRVASDRWRLVLLGWFRLLIRPWLWSMTFDMWRIDADFEDDEAGGP